MQNIKKIIITFILITSSLYYTPVATENNQPKQLTRTIDYGRPENVTENTATARTTNNSTATTNEKNKERRTGRRKAWWDK